MNPFDYKMDPLDIEWVGFFAFIEERSKIWRRKEVDKSLPPWTDDHILAIGKFGNVWRKLDRGTIWETEQVKKWDGNNIGQLMLLLTYRHNLIPRTTTMLMEGLGPADIVANDDRPIMSDVIKIWPMLEGMSGAVGEHAKRKMWAVYVYEHYKDVQKNVVKFRDMVKTTDTKEPWFLHAAIQVLFPRLGEFKAYEVLTSMSYLNWICFTENDLLHVGHGAMPMLRMLTCDTSTADNLMHMYLHTLAPVVRKQLIARGNMTWPDHIGMHGYPFTTRTLEDCLCEYRKYCEVKKGSRPNKPYPDNLRRWE